MSPTRLFTIVDKLHQVRDVRVSYCLFCRTCDSQAQDNDWYGNRITSNTVECCNQLLTECFPIVLSCHSLWLCIGIARRQIYRNRSQPKIHWIDCTVTEPFLTSVIQLVLHPCWLHVTLEVSCAAPISIKVAEMSPEHTGESNLL